MVESRLQQIEEAASLLFRARGYAATSVRDIARSIDLQGGSLYAHVASKEDLLWAIVGRAADRFQAVVRPIAEDTSRSAAERLRAMVHAHARVVTDDLGNATVFLHEWRFLGDTRRAETAQRRDDYELLFRRVLTEGRDAGEFETDDPKLAATLILSALNGIAGWYRSDGPLTPETIATHYAASFTRALGPNGGIDR
jgi:AcrR family transcriptional regulator